MTSTVNVTDIFIAPDDTSLSGIITAQRAVLLQVVPPPPNWRVLDAQVKMVAYAGTDPAGAIEINGTINTGNLEDDTDALLLTFADAIAPLYEEGNPDRITVIVEVIEED